jgi:hypothetical protein
MSGRGDRSGDGVNQPPNTADMRGCRRMSYPLMPHTNLGCMCKRTIDRVAGSIGRRSHARTRACDPPPASKEGAGFEKGGPSIRPDPLQAPPPNQPLPPPNPSHLPENTPHPPRPPQGRKGIKVPPS